MRGADAPSFSFNGLTLRIAFSLSGAGIIIAIPFLFSRAFAP
jgi:hypothetical protein